MFLNRDIFYHFLQINKFPLFPISLYREKKFKQRTIYSYLLKAVIVVKRLSFTTLKRILHILQKLYSSNTQILQFLLRNQNIYNEEKFFVNLILRSERANQTKLLVIIVLLHRGISVLSNVVFFVFTIILVDR